MALNYEKIRSHLSEQTLENLAQIKVFAECDSTNAWLLQQLNTRDTCNQVCLADAQTSGSGRFGKLWISTPGKNVLLSFAAHFPGKITDLSALSLGVGVMLIDALTCFSIQGLTLKWPNDVYHSGSKLAGILIQICPHIEAGCWAVIGVGVNLEIDAADAAAIDQPVAQLVDAGFDLNQREALIAQIIEQLSMGVSQFKQAGFAPFRIKWSMADHFIGQKIALKQAGEETIGYYLGITGSGAVVLRLASGQLKEYYAGELSLQPRQ